ncbi:secondary metabolism regulator laeA [Colletotrichum spaethianum]|uniref:Secondary metabolism regulator laeA n=1 Tax=Colletotrichum spaethianum TaxID=700344 RepID=A0AA37NWK1_9PEZI|nr:secondary metabolism regulator laeA [Colletotrichum spaethianum]GKT41435.1 secondary metabolism regulator laeA [Colletotrichum spaethianum]
MADQQKTQPASQPLSTADRTATQPAVQPESDAPTADKDAMAANHIDAASLGGLSADKSQAVLLSSILDYRRENGRTYHRLSDGKYVIPNDELEQERLDIANHLWMLTWDGKFCLCPKNEGAKRVLDVGTGTGIWALDYADEHPEATVIGVDLSPIQPGFVPPNCFFEVDDVEQEWTWPEPFDLIFSRNMAGSLQDWRGFVAQAFGHLEPGGYLEVHDNLYPLECDDGTLKEDSALFQWSKYIVEATDKIGRPITIAPQIPKILEDVGFEDVVVTRQKMPASPWAKDPKLRELGSWTQASLLPGIEGLCLALFTRVLGWKPAEILVFCANVRKDARNLGIHAYWYGYSIYGRKPFPKGEKPAHAS